MNDYQTNGNSPAVLEESSSGAPIVISRNTPSTTIERVSFLQLDIPNGTLVTGIGVSPVWLVISGVRYGYTSMEKFLRVHNQNATIYTIANVGDIPEGAPFADDLELISAENRPVFLLNDRRMTGFSSGEIFNSYQCNWRRVNKYSQGVIDAIAQNTPFPPPR